MGETRQPAALDEPPMEHDHDFHAAIRLLQSVVTGDVQTDVALTRDEAKAVHRYILRLQERGGLSRSDVGTPRTKLVRVSNELLPRLTADWSEPVHIRIDSEHDDVLVLHFKHASPADPVRAQ